MQTLLGLGHTATIDDLSRSQEVYRVTDKKNKNWTD